MMTDLNLMSDKTRAFAEGMVAKMTEAIENGDAAALNKLGQSRAAQFLINNVASGMMPLQVLNSYPQYVRELNEMREAYEAAEAQEQRVTTLESQLADLKAALTEALATNKAIIETQTAKQQAMIAEAVQAALADQDQDAEQATPAEATDSEGADEASDPDDDEDTDEDTDEA